MKQLDPIDDTYNRTKPPFKDDSNHTIIFAMTKYYVPDEAKYNKLYLSLSNAVSLNDHIRLREVIESLEQYRVGPVTKKQYRQTELVNVKTGKVVG